MQLNTRSNVLCTHRDYFKSVSDLINGWVIRIANFMGVMSFFTFF